MSDSNVRGFADSKLDMFNTECRPPPASFEYRSSDEEPLMRQPPKPTLINSISSEPDPDLHLTPLKQNKPARSLLRPHGANPKVRHRVRFQESAGSSSESIDDAISKVMIAEDFSEDCEIARENTNNNSLSIAERMFPDVSSPNSSNCMFLEDSIDSLSPRLLSVEVIREKNQTQSLSTSTSISDFPTEDELQTDNTFVASEKGSQNRPKDRIPSSEILTKTIDPKGVYFESLSRDEKVATQKRKMAKSIAGKENHFFRSGTVGTDADPIISSTSSLSVNAVDRESTSLFGEPKLNSTLQIAQRIKTLQGKRPNLTSELKKNLENEQQRKQINEKAACKVDLHPNKDLYSGLVSLDVTNFELEEAAITQRQTKVKPVKKKPSSGLEPDLLEFFTEDLQKETAVFSLPGIRNRSIETCKAPALIAFDLYCHNRMWDGLPGIV